MNTALVRWQDASKSLSVIKPDQLPKVKPALILAEAAIEVLKSQKDFATMREIAEERIWLVWKAGRTAKQIQAKHGEVGRGGGDRKSFNLETLTHTEIGVSAPDLWRWKMVAELEKAQVTEELRKVPQAQLPSLNKMIGVGKKATKGAAEEEAIADVDGADLSDVCSIECMDFKDYLPTCKADVIVTDPPYPKEYLPLYADLAKLATRFSLVAVMCGQSYLPEILASMTKHLRYCWTFAYMTPGGQAAQLWQREVLTFWKPVLIFGELPDWAGDVVKSDVNANEKDHHHWGQSVSGMVDLIKRVTKPGQTICDPFMGGGTTAIAALAVGRKIVGCDVDADSVETSRQRVAKCRK